LKAIKFRSQLSLNFFILNFKYLFMPQRKAPAKKIAAKKDAAQELLEFFEDGLKDMYWAEKALLKALPLMKVNASSAKLKTAIDDHIAETQQHVTRLEEVFAILGKKAKAEKCDAMDGLLKEGKSILKETEPGAVRDAGIIAASQKVEHYEIATYGTLATYASQLGHKDAVSLLKSTLQEEKNCDKLLSKIAVSEVNIKAK